MSVLDEKCPHCGAKQSQIYSQFEAHDYAASFEYACGACGETIDVIVHTVPDFETRKPSCPKCHRGSESSNKLCGQCLSALSSH